MGERKVVCKELFEMVPERGKISLTQPQSSIFQALEAWHGFNTTSNEGSFLMFGFVVFFDWISLLAASCGQKAFSLPSTQLYRLTLVLFPLFPVS